MDETKQTSSKAAVGGTDCSGNSSPSNKPSPASVPAPASPASLSQLPRGRVRSVNISARKGTRKTPCSSPVLVVAQHGLEQDAHAGDWHRQVSLLAWESIQKARAFGLDVAEGDFAENVTTEGIDLLALPLGTQVRVGKDVLLELSQIGKVCHTKCAIYRLAGDCIFPREGVFFVALEGGLIQKGDQIEVLSLGDGSCAYTPSEALEELRASQVERAGSAKRHAGAERMVESSPHDAGPSLF